MKKKSIIILGSGIARLFLANLLLKTGYKVIIFEKLIEEDYISAASNRSYKITFFGMT